MSERFVWIGPVRHIGGYGEVARGMLSGLKRIGADVVAVDSHAPVGAPDRLALAELEDLLAGAVREDDATCVYHAAPGDLERVRELFPMVKAARHVACTISETDRLSESWVETLQGFDEVWVPATFQREVFALSGVARERIRVVRYGVDAPRWRSGANGAPRAPHDGAAPFRFLYCFQLGWRKGFDLLLEAFLSEFQRDEPVELALKLLPAAPGGPTRSDLVTSIVERIDFLSGDLPRVRVIEDELGFDAMRALYESADLYISTDRANGWGMPCHEAMACGTASATIDWSGSTEFMHEGNALLIPPGPLVDIDPRLVAHDPQLAGHRWPSIEVADVRQTLRGAFESRAALRSLGERGADEIASQWSLECAASAVVERDTNPYKSRPGLLDKVLPGLGLTAPGALFQEARSRVVVCPFRPGADDWQGPLERFLAQHSADDDVTFCLWADSDSSEALDPLAEAISAAIAASGPAERCADVQLTVASSDHVPWERAELDRALLPDGSPFSTFSAHAASGRN